MLIDVDAIPATLATRRARFAAFLIDALIGVTLRAASRMPSLSVIGLLLSIALLAFGVVQIILISTRGQTIGKMLLKVAIVDRVDKTPPGFVRAAVIRQVPMIVVSVFWPLLVIVYLALDSAPIFLPARRCLHDYLAGTIVATVEQPRDVSEQAASV